MKKKVEVFTAGCSVCSPVVEFIKTNASESCEVIIYDLIEQCDSKECLSKAQEYGINSIPAVAVDKQGRACKCRCIKKLVN